MRYIILLLLSNCWINGVGQDVDSVPLVDSLGIDTIPQPMELELISTYHDGRILLRWAPTTPEAFLRTLAAEYLIERYNVTNAHADTNSRKEIIVKPWEEERFRSYMDLDEPYILTAGQSMYGSSESAGSGDQDFAGRYQEVINRYGMALLASDLDPHASEALGWMYADSDVEEGKRYFYRITARDTTINLQRAFLSEVAIEPIRPAPLFESISEEEASIALYWSSIDYRPIYTGFHIERSKNGVDFTRVTTNPIVYAKSDDYAGDFIRYQEDVNNYDGHYYRIIGITPFGFDSAPSEAVFAMARDRTPPTKPQNVYIDTDPLNNTVNISWELSDDPEIAGVQVFMSYQFDGEARPVSGMMRANTEEFTDTITDRFKFHYYKIATVDSAGNFANTLPYLASFRDTVPPNAPLGLIGNIDTSGIVSLSWNANTEPDLLGYSVYFSNQEDHMYNNLSPRPQRDTFFVDTLQLNTTTEDIYYKIVATDFHYHVSEFCGFIKLNKPDIIPPNPPRFKAINQKDGKIYLDIITSKAKDVESQVLYRKLKEENTFTEIGEIYQGVFIDSLVLPGVAYTYRAIATDDDGLEAFGEVIIHVRDGRRPGAPTLSVIYDHEVNTMNLSWSLDDQAAEYMIYRSVDKGGFANLIRLTPTKMYTDSRIIKGKQYGYKIKVRWSNGIISPFSETIIINTSPQTPTNE